MTRFLKILKKGWCDWWRENWMAFIIILIGLIATRFMGYKEHSRISKEFHMIEDNNRIYRDSIKKLLQENIKPIKDFK